MGASIIGRRVTSLDLNVSLKGGLFTMKGYPDGIQNVVMHVDTRATGIQISAYPGAGRRGNYTAGRIWIEDISGKVLDERADFHQRLHASSRPDPWDQLDRLAFVSYAMWEYMTVPFLLAESDVTVEEIEPHQEYDKPWRRLRAVFPKRIPIPSPQQTFYFDDDFMLRRFDFKAVGNGAHYCFDPVSFDGLIFPTLRRIIAQEGINSLFSAHTGVLIDIADVRIAK